MRKLTISVLSILLASVSVVAYPRFVNSNETINSTNTRSAKAIFEAAYRNRYTWNQNFPGYTAKVLANYGGKEERGVITVYPNLEVEVKGIGDLEIAKMVEDQILMEIIHRRNIPFEQLHGQSTFKIQKENFGTTEIEKIGDDSSLYKVKDRTIIQVNRPMGEEMAVTVDTLETTATPEGYLSSEYLATFYNPKTNEVVEKERTIDRHQKVGDYYLLSFREVYQNEASPKSDNPDIAVRYENLSLL
ncbi:DUF3386 family protein [Myxosarcina sp. GI1]|uniref:DUF3386 family protein n=1 Tax=Myxosarcina sp. GI1 TaxID=1541065 RepID=UPI00068CDC65|nr:DUF3386 family protein [Myxosarcina sp. GI1]